MTDNNCKMEWRNKGKKLILYSASLQTKAPGILNTAGCLQTNFLKKSFN